MGLVTELLTYCRRAVLAASPRLRRSPRAFRAAMGLAFAVQVTLGYLLMLAAMTYQGELFIAVIAGLAVGHLAFNVSQPVGESTDACCVDPLKAPIEGRTVSRPPSSPGDEAAGVAMLAVTADEVTPAKAMPEMMAGGIGGGGGPAAVELTILPIHCQNCIDRTTAALVGLDGVRSVHVAPTGATILTLANPKDREAVAKQAVERAVVLGKSVSVESLGDTASPAP